jgi:hypothetical protein
VIGRIMTLSSPCGFIDQEAEVDDTALTSAEETELESVFIPCCLFLFSLELSAERRYTVFPSLLRPAKAFRGNV